MARKEAVFKMKLDSDDAAKDVKDLNKDFTHLRDTIETDVSGSISAMEDRLYEMAAAGDTSSKEFRKLEKETAKYKKTVIETDRRVDSLAEQGKGLSNALSLAEGTVAGFQAFTGVQALLGDENEELLKTITKLQAAQGVFNSIQVIKQQLQEKSIAITRIQTGVQKALNVAVGSGSKAMKLFRGALLATGIGALIVGIGALIANFDKLKRMITGVSETQEMLNKAQHEAVSAISEELNALDELSDTINEENTSREDKVAAVQSLQKEYPDLLKNIDAEKTSTEELNKFIGKNTELIMLQSEMKVLAKLREEELEKQIQASVAAKTGENEAFYDGINAISGSLWGLEDYDSAQKIAAQRTKEATDEAEKNITVLDEHKKAVEEKIKAILEGLPTQEDATDADEKAAEANKKAAEAAKDRRQAALDLKESLEELERTVRRRNLTDTAKNLEDIKEQRDEELRIAKEGFEQGLRNEKQYENLKLQILRDFKERRDEILPPAVTATLSPRQVAEVETTKTTEKLKTEAVAEGEMNRVDLADRAASSINSITQSMFEVTNNLGKQSSKAQEKRAERQFQVQKGLDIVTAGIDTAKAITQAIAQFGPPPSPLGIAGIASASAIGAAQIAAISSKQFKAGNVSGGGGSAGSGGSIQGAGAGSFSMTSTGESDTTDLNPDGTQVNSSIPDQKVYVVEQDITNTQNKVKAVESISTF